MYKATSQSKIVTDNTILEKKGYTTIRIKNIGESAAVINDNIPLASGEVWNWENLPGTVIDENTSIRFTPADEKKILVETIYYK